MPWQSQSANKNDQDLFTQIIICQNLLVNLNFVYKMYRYNSFKNWEKYWEVSNTSTCKKWLSLSRFVWSCKSSFVLLIWRLYLFANITGTTLGLLKWPGLMVTLGLSGHGWSKNLTTFMEKCWPSCRAFCTRKDVE